MTDISPNSGNDLEIELVDCGSETGNLEDVDVKPDVDLKESDKEDASNDASKSSNGDDKPSNSSVSAENDCNLKICTSSSETKSVRSRIFVGHLNTKKATRRDLENVFDKCGNIEAISLQSGYGFVQFDNEESALKAINKYHGMPFMGMRLVVDKPAAWKKLDGEDPRQPKPWPKTDESPGRSSRRRSRSPPPDWYRKHRGSRRSRSPRHRDYDHFFDGHSRYRDPEYERFLEMKMRYMEERLAERYHYERLYDRYPPPPPRGYPGGDPSFRGMGGDRYDYAREYDFPRDDEFDRERRPFDYSYR